MELHRSLLPHSAVPMARPTVGIRRTGLTRYLHRSRIVHWGSVDPRALGRKYSLECQFGFGPGIGPSRPPTKLPTPARLLWFGSGSWRDSFLFFSSATPGFRRIRCVVSSLEGLTAWRWAADWQL